MKFSKFNSLSLFEKELFSLQDSCDVIHCTKIDFLSLYYISDMRRICNFNIDLLLEIVSLRLKNIQSFMRKCFIIASKLGNNVRVLYDFLSF